MKAINVKCPTRVDLAGGTLDLWPLFSFFPNVCTTNVAIDIFTFVELSEADNIEIHVADLNYQRNFANLDLFLDCRDKEIDLIKPVVRYWSPKDGFSLKTSSESPVGGGLGGSSSLTVGLNQAFSEFMGEELELETLITLCHNQEAQLLRTPTGTQDYYAPALKSGMMVIDYGLEGRVCHQVEIPAFLREKFLLVYTGRPHHSGLNNWRVLKDLIDGDEKTHLALRALNEVAQAMKQAILGEDSSEFAELFKKEYKARSQLSEAFLSPEIEKLNTICQEIGGVHIKICGAGGGGCVMIWVEDGSLEKVMEECQNQGYQVLNAKPIRLSER